MSVAKIIEISARSPDSFEAAIQEGIHKAGESVHNIREAWIADQTVGVTNGEITEYKVLLKVTFIVD